LILPSRKLSRQTTVERAKQNQFPFLSPLTRKQNFFYPLRTGISDIEFSIRPSSIDSMYQSTCSIPVALNNRQKFNQQSAPDSPRSTRSAGWVKSQQRGLFGINSSPKSVRSATSRNGNNASGYRQRSSSVESQSSNDSRSGRRHRSRSKRISDNESEISRGSGRSHRKNRRHRSRNRDAGSDRGGSSHRDYNQNELSLVDSGKQWLEVQRKQSEMSNMGTVQQASVVKSSIAPKSSHSTDTYNRSKKTRKHR
jgi:band 4.1-like protein 4A